jgi:hypothetical protein
VGLYFILARGFLPTKINDIMRDAVVTGREARRVAGLAQAISSDIL